MRPISLQILFIFGGLVASGCQGAEPGSPPASATTPDADPTHIGAELSVAGKLEDKDIREASGLAASQRQANILWTHNDSGAKARLYAIDLAGRDLGRIKLTDADNKDWEDIASFSYDNKPYLLVGDIGDNAAKREQVTLYVVEEPDLGPDRKPELAPAWRIHFVYPDGPRDAESLAVDLDNEVVLILSKRTIPPQLYSVPLRPETEEVLTATKLGEVSTLPRPTRRDIEYAEQTKDWHWQPTGMDIARDGSALAIVTYLPAIYLYERKGDWHNSLQQAPLRYPLRLKDPESIAFSADSSSLYITNEKKHAVLLRVDIKRDTP
jgi:hypothetical protein